MATICVRLDDIHGRTPLPLLRRLDAEVWRDIPVTLAAIPYPAYGCLGPTATPREHGAGRSTLASAPHHEYLQERVERGDEIALHGLTHADHRHSAGRSAAELVAASAERLAWLDTTMREWRRIFGTAVLVPPHNYIDAQLSRQLAESGITVCRAITDEEVASLGLEPTGTGNRLKAKQACSYRSAPQAVEIFQTLSLSPGTPGLREQPELVADILLGVAHSAGVAVATFHWWDFVGPVAEDFTTLVGDFLTRLRTDPEVEFSTIGRFADRTCAGGRPPSPAP